MDSTPVKKTANSFKIFFPENKFADACLPVELEAVDFWSKGINDSLCVLRGW
jgi:hypothetical protein